MSGNPFQFKPFIKYRKFLKCTVDENIICAPKIRNNYWYAVNFIALHLVIALNLYAFFSYQFCSSIYGFFSVLLSVYLSLLLLSILNAKAKSEGKLSLPPLRALTIEREIKERSKVILPKISKEDKER